MKDDLINTFKVSRLMAEDMAGCLDDVKRRELDTWLLESVENQKFYQDIKEELDKGRREWPYSERQVERQLEEFYQRKKKVSRRMIVWWRYAAVVILLLGIVGVIRWQREGRQVEKEITPILQARGNAMLVLSTGEKIALSDSIQAIRGESSVNIRVAEQMISYRNESDSVREQVYNVLFVPRGGEFKVELADGTNVWLNSQSELRYPVRFSGEQRVVYLKGEGYFEVASDRDKPFIVKTSEDVNVRVLGTKFNLSAYAEDMEVVTTLAEGSVEVIMSERVVRIAPNEQVVFNKLDNTFRQERVDASIYSAWKDGALVFENQTLEQIMDRLKRWYEMEVFYTDDKVKDYRFTGDLKKYENFEKTVRMLEEVAGAKVEINGKCVVIGTK